MRKIWLLTVLLQSIMFWNVENFFDWKDGGSGGSDKEFSTKGERRWTRKRFLAKTDAIGKTVLWCGAPEIVAFEELENGYVLKRLCRSDLLRKLNYRYIHYESHDKRGIDVGLIYRSDLMEVVTSQSIPVIDGQDTLQTRDILYVCLKERSSGEKWHILVNHHPSKLGGGISDRNRELAMKTLKYKADSLLAEGETNIVAGGDFNDAPEAGTFDMMEGSLVNLGKILSADLSLRECTGTIRYNGKWELIDNILVSVSVSVKKRMEIARPPFLLVRDRRFPGEKPFRTYTGLRYNGGVSDHLPVMLN